MCNRKLGFMNSAQVSLLFCKCQFKNYIHILINDRNNYILKTSVKIHIRN